VCESVSKYGYDNGKLAIRAQHAYKPAGETRKLQNLPHKTHILNGFNSSKLAPTSHGLQV